MNDFQDHIEEISGAATSGIATPLLIINGFVDNLLGAVVVAAVSAAIGAVISFYIKLWLTKKHK